MYRSVFKVGRNIPRVKRWLILTGIACVLAAGLPAQAQQPAGTYNVKTDGTAQGNGSNDDTSEIQAALNAAKSQGKDVYFPAGTYIVSGQIDVPNTTSIFGDKSGVSLIKSVNPVVEFGEPDNDGSTVGNLSIEDMFFLNISVFFTGTKKDDITVRRCVLATDKVHSSSWFLSILSRGDDNTIEDSIFLAGHNTGNWPGMGVMLKGINTYRNNRMHIHRNIFGMDLGNLTWLDTEWAGYASWTNVEARLEQFRTEQGLPRRMGEMSGGIRLNKCDGSVVDKNIFHMDPIATEVPQTTGNLDVDHLIYATQATNLEITRNWLSGQPPNPGGGLKHRDTTGPGVIAANYLNDTPIILYTYDNDLTHDFENQLIYRNYLKITDFDTLPGMGMRLGIWFWSTDWQAPEYHTGKNIDVAENIYDVDPQSRETDVPIEITYGTTGPGDWRIYNSNIYLDSGNPIPIAGNGYAAPYSYTAGSPSGATWDLAKYDAMSIPFLNIPPFGTDPTNAPPVFDSDPVVEADAVQNIGYTGSLADNASDAENDPMIFSKVSGPTWLSVATNGVLSGTPGPGDVGTNSWAVQVFDATGTNSATLEITVNFYPGSRGIDSSYEWIANVNIGSINRGSGDDGGYYDATSYSTSEPKGGSVPFSLTKGLLGGEPYFYYWRIWIDLNHDGDFVDADELVYSLDIASSNMTSGSFTMPTTHAYTGETRMRVSMKWDADGVPASTEIFPYGEVEDYTINITAGNNAPIFTSSPIVETNATKDTSFSGSIADNASDDDGNPMTFSKISGPAWLNVASGGAITGIPDGGDVGLNAWVVQVSDGLASNTAILQVTVDSDGDWDDDGIPDFWELQYFGHATNAVASGDGDGDEFDNISEYISGFDPTNSTSYPVITGFEMLEGGTNIVISWEALSAGRAYDVVWANNLTGSFSNVESNILYPQSSYTGTVSQIEPLGFYRINFKLQDTP